jgi:hypothetical protein
LRARNADADPLSLELLPELVMGGISATDVYDLGWFRIGITRHRDSLQTALSASDSMISHPAQDDNCIQRLATRSVRGL